MKLIERYLAYAIADLLFKIQIPIISNIKENRFS